MIALAKVRGSEVGQTSRFLRSDLNLNDLCGVCVLRQDRRQGSLDRGLDLAQTSHHIERSRIVGHGILSEPQAQGGEVIAVECERGVREGVADLFLHVGVLRRCEG